MKIEKYKPKYHKDIDKCTENCERDCNMECDICRKTPYETNFYYIIDGENHSFQWCEKCFEELKKCLKGKVCVGGKNARN
jgi:hypothetical protein